MGFPYLGQPVLFGEPIGMQAGGAEETLNDYLAELAPQIDWRLDETSGSVVQNYGTGGSDGNGANIESIPVNQTVGGRAGVYNYTDGDQNISVATNALVNTTLGMAAAWTVGCLCYPRTPNTAPFVGFGRLWARSSDSVHWALINSATLLSALQFTADGATTDALTTTSTGLAINTWQWIFARFNLANSQLIDVFTYTSAGGLVECTYNGARTAMVGGPASVTTKTWNVGNQLVNNRGVNWALARHFAINSALSNDVLTQIGALTPGI